MAWKIELGEQAEKTFSKLGAVESRRIAKTLRSIAELPDPTLRGEALTGNLAGFWRYRVGDWRVIARLEHPRLVISVVSIGHRSDIYR